MGEMSGYTPEEEIDKSKAKKKSPAWLNIALAGAVLTGAAGMTGCVEGANTETDRFQATMERIDQEHRDLRPGFVIENKEELLHKALNVDGIIANVESQSDLMPTPLPTNMTILSEEKITTADLVDKDDSSKSIKIIDTSGGLTTILAEDTQLQQEASRTPNAVKKVIGVWEQNTHGDYFLQVYIIQAAQGQTAYPAGE